MIAGVKHWGEALHRGEANLQVSCKTGVKCEAGEVTSSKDRCITKLLILHRLQIWMVVKAGVVSELSLPASPASPFAKIQQPVGEPFASRLWAHVPPSKWDKTKNTKAAKNPLNYCHRYNNSFFNALDYGKYTGEICARSLGGCINGYPSR